MKLESEGILISLKPFNEKDAVGRIFTRDFGVLGGMLKGGVVAKKNKPLIGQVGAVAWNARLDSQLGTFHWEAEKNLAALKRSQDVTFLTGDAEEVLKNLKEQGNQYDFVFMDAAKAQYMSFLAQILPMLPAGALLITDNVLQEGSIIESKYSITRRDRTIHMRMREYLYELKHNDALTTSIVAVGDGMALSVKK